MSLSPNKQKAAVWYLTLVQATSCEVERAHCVAAVITRFCSAVSSATCATFFAFSTSSAAALATALARFIMMSCNVSRNNGEKLEQCNKWVPLSDCYVVHLDLLHVWGLNTTTNITHTWNLSSVSPSPMWRSRSPLACPMLPAAVSTVCLG